MSQFVVGPTRTFTAGEAIARHLRAKFGGSTITTAGYGEKCIGTLEARVLASGDEVAVRLLNAEGTRKVVAAGAISAGAVVYGAASGKVNDVYSADCLGIALEAAGADGDVIEILVDRLAYLNDIGTLAATGSTSADAAVLVNYFTSVSAADGTKGVALPAAHAGARMLVYNSVATNGLKIYPVDGGNDDINDGTEDAAITIEGKTLAEFNCLDGTTWTAQYTANT